MRRGKGGGFNWGIGCIVAGVVIIMAIVLPSQFWWFMLAACLIAAGVWCLRCR